MATMAYNGAFYQLPKSLFANEKYRELTIEAKLLYAIMRDRFRLSIQNQDKWNDALGIYIKMARKTMCDLLQRSEPTIRKIVAELVSVGLISERRMGLTQCNRIYVQGMEGESETVLRSGAKDSNQSETKPASAPEQKPVSPNKNPRSQIQFRKLTKKPEFPKDGDIWEENGQKCTYHHGYTQRYYEPEVLNALFYNC